VKRYKYEEWGLRDDEGLYGGFDDRTYVDQNDNPITGILEGFYFFSGTTGTEDEKNCQYVENGKRKNIAE